MGLNKEKKLIIKHYRRVFQFFFFTLALYSWIRLYLFVKHFDDGWPYVERPTSIDAFLPIGALVSLKNLIYNHFIDPIHPAALVIFLAIISSAVLLGRGFCGWICPVGFLSEITSLAGEKIAGKNLKGFEHAKAVKYLLLVFFLYLIIPMNPESVHAFIFSPYWAIADVKLLDFWLNPGRLTIIFTTLIIALNLFVRNFWCRFLCPYGALLSILSSFSPFEIRKNNCNGCGICERKCPSCIKIMEKDSVKSLECISCLECVNSCPNNYLKYRLAGFELRRELYPLLIASIIFGFVIIAKITGNWDSSLSYEDYRKLLAIRHLISH